MDNFVNVWVYFEKLCIDTACITDTADDCLTCTFYNMGVQTFCFDQILYAVNLFLTGVLF